MLNADKHKNKKVSWWCSLIAAPTLLWALPAGAIPVRIWERSFPGSDKEEKSHPLDRSTVFTIKMVCFGKGYFSASSCFQSCCFTWGGKNHFQQVSRLQKYIGSLAAREGSEGGDEEKQTNNSTGETLVNVTAPSHNPHILPLPWQGSSTKQQL